VHRDAAILSRPPAGHRGGREEAKAQHEHTWRFRVAYAALALLALGAAAALALLVLEGAAHPGRLARSACAGPAAAPWSEQGAVPSGTSTGLLALRLSDRSVHALLASRGTQLDHPAYAPDGRRLAVLTRRRGLTAGIDVCSLARGSTTELRLPVSASVYPVSWDPAGRRLVFLGGDVLGYGADQKPYIVDVRTGRVTRLAGDAAWYWDGVAFSPSGDKLAFLLMWRYPTGGAEPEQLSLLDTRTGKLDRVAGSRQVAQIDSFSWSPDGSRIVFTGYKRDDHGDLYVVDVRTKRIRTLLGSKAGERQPAWSPDGRSIAFVGSPAGRPHETSIWVVDLVTGRPERLTWGTRDVAPAWSPDGSTIAFVRRG
jgi:Tol biopolymer transport system component